MSTPNFKYKNRCIVVSDDDYENGNYPEYEGENEISGNRNYPSYKLREQPEGCGILIAILTGAYYSGACIDYIVDPNWEEETDPAQLEQEANIMNKFLDKIVEGYGLEEVKCMAVFSNGEAMYEKVKTN